MENYRNIEILAPAGSKESMIAAFSAGADAVYIGGSRFGARAFADNLAMEELLAAIDYAHVRDKKLYLTVNTLLKQSEMESVCDYIRPYYREGLDAAIVQDVGVMRVLHREFPDLAIHASTQMTLTMAEGAKYLKDCGVTRLVNARELSLKEIAGIRANTKLEIESFVHGALCYSYSGQCLMSSMLGGRSGNRGRCAQPCRMQYAASSKNSREMSYLLSPKDICTLDMIPELIEAGIDSFKIEGRMKRFEYSAGVTAAYKEEVERYFSCGKEKYLQFHKEHPEYLYEKIRDLKDLYNRGGFTRGYYSMHNGPELMSMERPNHSGVKVGTVVKVQKNAALISAIEPLNAQDILEIRMRGGESYEFTLKEGCEKGVSFWANFMPGSDVRVQDEVYRTKNNKLLNRLSQMYYETEKKLLVQGYFFAGVGCPMELTLTRGDTSVTVTGEVVQAALNQPVTEEKISKSLNKTGETIFAFDSLEVSLNGDIFVPVAKLNELRRRAFEKLTKALAERFFREDCDTEKENGSTDIGANIGGCDKSSVRRMENTDSSNPALFYSASVVTTEQLEAVLASGKIARIYYDIAALPEQRIPEFAKKAKHAGKEFFVRLPQIVRTETYAALKEAKDKLADVNVDGYLVRSYEGLYLISSEWAEETKKKQIITDAMLYVMNREAKAFYQDRGITSYTAPLELTLEELKEICDGDMEVICYGRVMLMTSAGCVLKHTTGCVKEGGKPVCDLSIADAKGNKMPVMTYCKYCYNTIYQAEKLVLPASYEGKQNIASYRYEFVTETSEEVGKILAEKEFSGREYTTGHYERNVW